MRAITAGAALAFVVALGAGCKQASSDYCDSNKPACPDGLFCDTINRVCIDTGPACDATHPCEIPDLPACVGGTCVQCDSPDDCADNQFPGCDGDNMCTGLCTDDNDCDLSSSVCMPDGSCAAVDDVIYTAPGAPASGDCTAAEPCDLEYGVETVLSADRYIVHLEAMQYDTPGQLVPAHDVVLVGRGATIRYNGVSDGSVIVVGGGVRVEIDFIAIRDGKGTVPTTVGNGIYCDGSSHVVANGMRSLSNDANGIAATDCTLELTGVEIDGNTFDGINLNSDSAMLDVIAASIHDNTNVGVKVVLGSAAVRRSIVRTNFHGGIEMGGADPGTIENSIIAGNGSGAPSSFGGVRFLFQDGNVFRFNVVSANISPSGASGEQCGNPVMGMNNILDDDVNSGSCRNDNSIFTTNAGSSSGDPIMTGVDPTSLFLTTTIGDPNYYHLKNTAVAKDFGAAQPDVLVDIDGQPRQFGSASDSGADEVQQ